MRLIDADALKQDIDSDINRCYSLGIGSVGVLCDLKDKIDRQPTAYDVDAVVEELNKLAKHYNKCCLADYNDGAAVGIRESIAIVRKGGVNE